MNQTYVRAATDVGGTFTDLVYYEYDIESQRFNTLKTAKVDTTPPDFEQGVMDVLRSAEVAPDSIHAPINSYIPIQIHRNVRIGIAKFF